MVKRFFKGGCQRLQRLVNMNVPISASLSCPPLVLPTLDYQKGLNFLSFILGGDDHQFEADIGRLKSCVSNIMSECYKGISSSLIKDDYVHEVCRYGAAEPHAMAALIGGCAAHEAIKLLTKQYVPVDNLFLFNSMTMNTVTLKIA